MTTLNVNPSEVLTGLVVVGRVPAAKAAPAAVAPTDACPGWVAVTVVVTEAPGLRPVTVTCPLALMLTLPPPLTVTAYLTEGS